MSIMKRIMMRILSGLTAASAVAVVLSGWTADAKEPVQNHNVAGNTERAAARWMNEDIERLVEERLQGMSLAEKIGQMTQLTIDVLGDYAPDGTFTLNEGKMDTIFGIYKVGAIFNAPGTRACSPERWDSLISHIQRRSIELTGIPCLYGLDQNHGGTYTLGATFFPQNIGMGATFNRDLMREAAAVTAYETRASNCPLVFGPTLDLSRNQSWPRVWENFGEDPFVNGEMGRSAVAGLQGDGERAEVAACLKHYMGYGATHSGRDRAPAYIPESDLLDKHFAPYREAIKGGALSVMCNSASVNGVPGHINRRFLTELLKDSLGWDGVLMTDWADVNQLHLREHVAKDKREALKMAVNAGIDMIMEPYDTEMCGLLAGLVESGEVERSRIDDAARRILRLKHRLGLFERPVTHSSDYPLFGSDKHRAVAAQAAEESMVLLKNEGNVLPLKEGMKILVTGPNADSMRTLNGGWTYTWQGKLDEGDMEDENTIAEALESRFGKDNVTYVAGVRYDDNGGYADELEPDYEAVERAAGDADCIVVCVGENSYCETPGNLSDLNLSGNQKELVRRVRKSGKPVVMVLNEGRARIIRDIEPLADAIVDIMLPGSSGGDALAGLLAGDSNFSGRLPFTYPREVNALTTYDYKTSEVTARMAGAYDYDADVDVQWPFGYGQSYTTFAYSDLKVDKSRFGKDDMLRFSVTVTNTGDMAGKESVLLFSSDRVASRIVPDNRRLRAFEKIELRPGESREVVFELPAMALSYVDNDGERILEDGAFMIQAGDQTLEVECI